MKLSQYRYHLPQELIALHPTENKDDARLMVLNRKEQTIEHKHIGDLKDYFDDGDVFVLNNTKVFPALLFGNKEKTDAEIVVTLLRELNKEDRLWDTLVDPARKIRTGNKLYFGKDSSLVAEVMDNTTSRGRILRFLYDGSYEDFRAKLLELGETPLPDHLQRLREIEPCDRTDYQTEYASVEGAVVAPAAGLHIGRMLKIRLEIKGVQFAEITLHAGMGNFRPIEVEDLSKHKIDSEEIILPTKAVNTINEAKEEGKRICAIGTTTLKALETSKHVAGVLTPTKEWTNTFIYPPFNFSIADALLTNFHLPQSTTMIMVSAFAGHELLMRAYKEAVEQKYRFLTYGDAMLII